MSGPPAVLIAALWTAALAWLVNRDTGMRRVAILAPFAAIACGSTGIIARGVVRKCGHGGAKGLRALGREHIENDMKRMLVEIDDRSARDLERVAPTRERKRAEFIRLAIRAAIDRALDRTTRDAYRRAPQIDELVAGDVEGWDERNALAVHARPQVKARRRRRSGARVA